MPPKNTDDQGENPDKLNFSKTQLTVIVGSIAAIVVLALALGFLTKKNEAKLEEQTKVEAPPVEQATELPPPEGAKKEELSKLEENLPKQVPQTPAEELKQKAEKKAESAPASPAAPAVPQKGAPAPAAVPSAATPAPAAAPQKSAAPAPAPGAIIEKTAPKPAVKVEEKNAEPAKEKKAKREKPKKKRIHERQRKTVAPLKKHVDVKKLNVAPKAEPHKEAKVKTETPVVEGKPAKLENKPSAASYTNEIKPDTVPPAPATVEVPAPPPPAPAAPKAAESKAVEPKAAEPKVAEPKTTEPKFTILAETVASEADAKGRVAALKQSGYQAHYLKKVTTKNTWYQVVAGAYATREEAETAAAEFGKKERTAAAKVLPYEKP